MPKRAKNRTPYMLDPNTTGLEKALTHIELRWLDAVTDNDSARLRPSYPNPHRYQQKLIDYVLDGGKRGVLLAGRRGGKTTGFAQLAVKAFSEGFRVLYATPTHDQIERFFYACCHYLDGEIAAKTLLVNKTKNLIERPGSTEDSPRIRAKTAWNSDTLRGDWGSLILIDEYQLMTDTLDNIILPMLLDSDGTVIYGGTPLPEKGNPLRTKYDIAVLNPGKWRIWHFTSHENPHLNKEALQEIASELTPLGYKQEILAEFVDIVENALWSMKEINEYRVVKHPPLIRTLTSVDPASWTGKTGITTLGVSDDNQVYVLESKAVSAEPSKWVAEAITQYHKFDSDFILYERNQGGLMVANAIQVMDDSIQCKDVLASKSKTSRAEPVQLLYERGRIHHVGTFLELESQMTNYVAGKSKSPDLMDSLVWGVYYYLLKSGKSPKGGVKTPGLW